jgi:hypothetical protein
MGGYDSTWRDFKPAGAARDKVATDRGSRRGAARCIVTADLQLLDHAVAKDAGIEGTFFQSRKEAKFFIATTIQMRAGLVRPIAEGAKWRQVRFPLFAVRPDGLKEKVCDLVLDFVYLRNDGVAGWTEHYIDVKPSGGHREDQYLLKRKWFEAQTGLTIEEV